MTNTYINNTISFDLYVEILTEIKRSVAAKYFFKITTRILALLIINENLKVQTLWLINWKQFNGKFSLTAYFNDFSRIVRSFSLRLEKHLRTKQNNFFKVAFR